MGDRGKYVDDPDFVEPESCKERRAPTNQEKYHTSKADQKYSLPDQTETGLENPNSIKLEARRLSFVFPSGEELDVDLVEFKLQLEEYTEGKANFREFRDDVVNLIKTKYKIKASITEAWQIAAAVEAVWEEFKKKVLEQQMLLLGITSTPSASPKQN